MVSEFRVQKILHIYKFLDVDGSGTIDKDDFSAERIANYQGWDKDGPKFKKTQAALDKIWEGLQKAGDADGDGKVTREEWLTMWEQFAKNPSTPLEWQNLYCKFIFDITDKGEDGTIDSEEYSAVLQGFGHTKEKSDLAFQKLSSGKSTVSWEEWQLLWQQYFMSDNEDDPGNFIFGLCTKQHSH